MSPKQPASKAEAKESEDTCFMQNALGMKIFCKYWRPETEPPKALVFIAHGLTEHCLCYDKLAIPLTQNGYFVFSHDHIGHGQSQGERGNGKAVEDLVADVYQHTSQIRTKYPDIPMYFIGHSLGGLVGILIGEENPGYFDGMVLIGPAILANSEMATPIVVTLSRFMGRYLPRFPVKRVDYGNVCFNSEAVKEISKDPLRFTGYIKAGLCSAIIQSVQKAHSLLAEFKDPFIVLQGEDDKICHVQGARDLFDFSASSDKKIKIYDNANHMLLYEWKNIDQQVIKDTMDWLNSHVTERLTGGVDKDQTTL